MTYRLDPAESTENELRRIARSCLEHALGELSGICEATADEVEVAVHEARKRCKEARAVARLVRPALGDEFKRFNRLVRLGAEELSSIRDAHAVLATFDDLATRTGNRDDAGLGTVRAQQALSAQQATESLRGGGEQVLRAQRLLTKARRRVRRWEVPDGFDPLGAGLAVTYQRGSEGLSDAIEYPSDDGIHEWRKAVKNLWYQVRLLEAAAPSVLSPLIAVLDDLADDLGHDHDLAVLIERLMEYPESYGGPHPVDRAVHLARSQQDVLRSRAFRVGASVYAEDSVGFVDRIGAYWETTISHGTEPSATPMTAPSN